MVYYAGITYLKMFYILALKISPASLLMPKSGRKLKKGGLGKTSSIFFVHLCLRELVRLLCATHRKSRAYKRPFDTVCAVSALHCSFA